MNSTKINNFSGGMTDRFLAGAANNRFYLADNMLIDDNGKLYLRNGWVVHSTAVQVGNWVTGLYVDSIPFNLPLATIGTHLFQQQSGGSFVEITGPAGNFTFPDKGTQTLEQAIYWRKQIIASQNTTGAFATRVYASDYTPAFTALTLGLPAFNAAAIAFSMGGGSTHSYVYAFHWQYTFTDLDGTEYEERGTPAYVTCATTNPINGSNHNSLSSIPVLANTSHTNYDVTNITVQIYRSSDGGTTYYNIGNVTNGTTTFVDSTPDSTVSNGSSIYTTGGVLPWDQTPTGTIAVTQTADIFWFVTSTTLYQSIEGAPGACPGAISQPLDQRIIGINSILSFPILFCEKSVYRISGNYDASGNGGYSFTEISQTAGCVSNRAIVRVPNGLVWPGNGGFYFTDGYTVQKISTGLYERYPVWKNSSMVGVYDSAKNIVYWTISTVSGASVNNALACLFLDFGISQDSVFCTQSSANNIYPTALAFTESVDAGSLREKLLCGESRGYYLYQDPLAYTDPYVDTALYPSQWREAAILYDFQSIGHELAGEEYRKWVTDVTIENRGVTDIAYRLYHRRDASSLWNPLSECRKDGVITWGISSYPWGDEAPAGTTSPTNAYTHDWNAEPMGQFKRPMPTGNLRTTRTQIRIRNSLTGIARSTDLGSATLNQSLKQLTLGGSNIWPYNCEDYLIELANDGYVTQYIIQTRNSDTTITVFDPLSKLPVSGSYAWQMVGYRKNERLYLLSYTIFWDVEGMTQDRPVGAQVTN